MEDLVIRRAGIVALADLHRLLRHLGYRPCCSGLHSYCTIREFISHKTIPKERGENRRFSDGAGARKYCTTRVSMLGDSVRQLFEYLVTGGILLSTRP